MATHKMEYYDKPTTAWIEVGQVIQEVVSVGDGILYVTITPNQLSVAPYVIPSSEVLYYTTLTKI